MVGLNFKGGKEQGLARGLMTASVRFHRHEDRVDLFQHLGIVTLQDPALLATTVLIENPEIHCLLSIWSAPAPGLKTARPLPLCLPVEIICVEDQRLAFGVEDASVGYL